MQLLLKISRSSTNVFCLFVCLFLNIFSQCKCGTTNSASAPSSSSPSEAWLSYGSNGTIGCCRPTANYKSRKCLLLRYSGIKYIFLYVLKLLFDFPSFRLNYFNFHPFFRCFSYSPKCVVHSTKAKIMG